VLGQLLSALSASGTTSSRHDPSFITHWFSYGG
jgi:hypothetical protein